MATSRKHLVIQIWSSEWGHQRDEPAKSGGGLILGEMNGTDSVSCFDDFQPESGPSQEQLKHQQKTCLSGWRTIGQKVKGDFQKEMTHRRKAPNSVYKLCLNPLDRLTLEPQWLTWSKVLQSLKPSFLSLFIYF